MFDRGLRWRDLGPGIIAVLVLFAVGFYILTRMGIGNLPGRKVTLYAVATQARGILRGSDIWIGGVRAGSVAGVTFLEPEPGVLDRVVIEMQLLDEHRSLLRRDSDARIRRGERIIGSQVIEISFGSARSAELQPGDTLLVVPQYDSEAVAGKARQALLTLPYILSDLRTVVTDARDVERRIVATTGGLRGESGPLAQLITSFGALLTGFESGSIALIAGDSTLAAKWTGIRAVADTLAGIYDVNGSIGARYIRDTRLVEMLERVGSEFAEFSRSFSDRLADYTTGSRAQRLQEELALVTASLRALQNDARRHPFRYIVF